MPGLFRDLGTAKATLELATLRRLTGKQQEAVILLVDLLQRDSYNFDGHVALGETLIELNRASDAATRPAVWCWT